MLSSSLGFAGQGLSGLLTRQASLSPSSPALLAPGRPALTYAAWDALVHEASATLREAGLGGGDRLAVVLPNGAATAASAVALTSVASIAPLSPASKRAELEGAFLELGMTGVVVAERDDGPARAVARDLDLPVIELLTHPDGPAGAFALRTGFRRDPASIRGEASDVAFLARTSGTTGAPKLIALRESNLLAAASACSRAFELRSSDRCLFAQPMFHAVALLTIGAVLSAHSSIVCLEELEPNAIFSSLECEEITWLSTAPAMYRALLERDSKCRATACGAGLRFLRTGSAAIDREACEQLEHAFAAPLVQCYGMTEAPFISSSPLPPFPRNHDSVGLPRGCEIMIVDDEGAPVEPGAAGELVVRGPNVTVDGWLHTGDVGRFDGDGYLFLLGRRKELINRGGQKIFPNEVERVLRKDDGIADVAVFASPHPTLGEDVAAAVILREGATRTEEALRRFAAERLAEIKVPKRILFLSEFPRTSMGKVQRHRLQALLAQRAADGIESNGDAVSLVEAQLVEIFEEVLGMPHARIDDDFFLCGGDSLRAARLIGALRSECAVELTLQTLFEAPTPKALARRISAALPAPATPVVRVQSGPKAVPLFFLNGDLGGAGVYMRQFAQRLCGDRTVYTLSPHGTNGIPLLETIEAMAADYARLIRDVVPRGPYLLGGYCNGGVVAYEVARILRAEGAEVGPLLLMASTARNAPYRAIRSLVRAGAKIFGWSAACEWRWYWRLRDRACALGFLRNAPASAYGTFFGDQLSHFVRRALRRTPDPEVCVNERFPTYEHMSEALARYFPGSYDGVVLHFWGEDDLPLLAMDPSMGWGRVATNLSLHRVPGDHLTIVTKVSCRLAAVVREAYATYP